MEIPWVAILAIVVLVLANGFFAAAEIAVISVRKSRILQLVEAGKHRAREVQRLQADPDRFLATIQIGITVISALTGAVGGVTAVENLKPYLEGIPYPFLRNASEGIALAIAVGAISYLSLIFGELVPKSLALRYPEQIALGVARPIEWLARISSVVIKLLTWSSRLLLKPFGAMPQHAFVSEEEIKSLLIEGREKGVFDSAEQELIHSVFEFTDISVKEVMVPTPKIHAIKVDTPTDVVLADMVENKFSRYPVYREDLNDICGILYYKDCMAVAVRRETVDLKSVMHPAYFVPESMKVSHLLKEMQRRHTQMAIVVNEYGNVEGLATMEDLIEEIVGEIRDEYDLEERPVERLKDGSLVVDAALSVRDLNEEYGLPIPESPLYETLGGFVMAQLQNIPRSGAISHFNQYKFTIVDMEGRRIMKVKVEKIPALADKSPASSLGRG
jgi:putative hemolysin